MTNKERSWQDAHWLQALLEGDDDPGAAPGEGSPIGKAPDMILPNDSVDAIIDQQLIGATKAVSAAKPKNESVRRRKSLREALQEADDEAPPAGPPAQQTFQKVDPSAMCREIARIVQNAENLVDLEGTVLRRSLNYVSKTYGPDTMDQVKSMLEHNYSISMEREEDRDENEPEYNAAGAGPEIGG